MKLTPDQALDESLRRNPHYAYCRELGQLAEARVVRVTGDAHAMFLRRLSARGQKIGDIKPTALSQLDGWDPWFGR